MRLLQNFLNPYQGIKKGCYQLRLISSSNHRSSKQQFPAQEFQEVFFCTSSRKTELQMSTFSLGKLYYLTQAILFLNLMFKNTLHYKLPIIQTFKLMFFFPQKKTCSFEHSERHCLLQVHRSCQLFIEGFAVNWRNLLERIFKCMLSGIATHPQCICHNSGQKAG